MHAASDQLAGLLSDGERDAFEDNLAGCDSCSCHTASWTPVPAELDPIGAGLVTLVDIEGALFSRGRPRTRSPLGRSAAALAGARFAVRAALDLYVRS